MAGQLKDQGVATLLKSLAVRNRGLCIVTTRYSLPDLKAFWKTTAIEQPLSRLSKAAGIELLRSFHLQGPERDFEMAVDAVQGHALSLNLLGVYLQRAHRGDIHQWCQVKFETADTKVHGGHAFRTMAAYERWLLNGDDEGCRQVAILRLMGLFDRPADAACLKALCSTSIQNLTETLFELDQAGWEFSLTGLEEAKLLTINRGMSRQLVSLEAHPLLREYFARQIRTKFPDAWSAAHQKLYAYLCESTHEGQSPTLEDLQPLYQAVMHGCQAGMQDDACNSIYFKRILRGDEFYSVNKLGGAAADLSAIACFFEVPWSRPSPNLRDSDKSWLLGEASTRLQRVGRLDEALPPIQAALNMAVGKEAASRGGTLSEIELMLGDVAVALVHAEQSVVDADRADEMSLRIALRTGYADVLHQSGRNAEALACFQEAEKLQGRYQPTLPLLHSAAGFRYCDLLLAAAERVAWQHRLGGGARAETRTCRAVLQRVNRTMQWSSEAPRAAILDTALDRLTLARATLYLGVMEKSPLGTCRRPLEYAVDGLRRSEEMDDLPRGLLTRSWFRFLDGDRTGPDSAQEDLDEAWEIAERCRLPLFQSDILLYRARLWGGIPNSGYPWDSPRVDLAGSRQLIEKHGYWRRKEELEDAETAAMRW
jgi:tetratricopeptide (TPR) repeat protein